MEVYSSLRAKSDPQQLNFLGLHLKVSNPRSYIFGLWNLAHSKWIVRGHGKQGHPSSWELVALSHWHLHRQWVCEHSQFRNNPLKSVATVRTHQTQRRYVAPLTPCNSSRESSFRTRISRPFSSKSHSQKLHLGGLPCLWVAIEQT